MNATRSLNLVQVYLLVIITSNPSESALLLSTIIVKDEGMHLKSMLWWCVIVMDMNLMNFKFWFSVGGECYSCTI